MTLRIVKGAIDQSINLEVLDTSTVDFARKTGLVFNSAGMTAYYVRSRSASVAIPLVTLGAPDSAHADGGFKEVDATNMPGIYRLDLPDAAVASGAESVIVVLKGAVSAAQATVEINLVDPVIAADVVAVRGIEIRGDGTADNPFGPS